MVDITFDALQEPLPLKVQQEILQELRSADRLRDTLDIVDIVLGFLSSGGGKAKRHLREYIRHALKMTRPFCQKVLCSQNEGTIYLQLLSVQLILLPPCRPRSTAPLATYSHCGRPSLWN